MSDVLGLRAQLAAPPAVVYRALTDETALRTWLAEHAEVSLRDQRFEFWGKFTPQGERGHQRLITTTADRLLRFAWNLDGTSTTVDIELEANGDDGTTVILRQDRLPTLEELMAPPGRRDGLHTMHTYWGLALANLTEYAEGRRLTPKADFRPSRPSQIRVRMEIAASTDAVFASLTDPQRIARWFGWEVEIAPRLGGTTTFGLEGTIFEFEPGRRLAYSDSDGAVVRWELEDAGGQTALTFVQDGYTADEWDSAAQHEAGWLGSLAELKRMHELGNDWAPLITELPAATETDESD